MPGDASTAAVAAEVTHKHALLRRLEASRFALCTVGSLMRRGASAGSTKNMAAKGERVAFQQS